MSSAQEKLHENILYKYVQYGDNSTKKVALELNTSIRTVQRVLKRFRETGGIRRQPGSGRKRGFVDKKIEKKVIAALQRKPTLSVRDLAKKCKTSKSTIQRVKKNSHIKSFKQTKVPNRNAKQQTESKTRSRKLYSKITKKNYCIVMDDETYCKLDFKSLPGHHFYSGTDRKTIDDMYKVIKTDKFAKKVLVWQAICSCGKRSTPYFAKGTVNGDIYLNECLKKRLLPFIKQHKKPVLFWPDLATCHYTKKAIEWYQTNNIEYVDKTLNPPNCPELRPIEKYWAYVKQKLLKHKSNATSVDNFKRKWNEASKLITNSDVQVLMAGVKRKLRNFWMNKTL